VAEIQKTRYTHEAMIDMIIAKPTISQNELAVNFGYTPGWVSQVMNSDAFREKLAERKGEIVDPRIEMQLEERIRGLADKSLEVLIEKLHETKNMNVAVRAFDAAARALGYGFKQNGPQVQLNNYVAIVPPKSANQMEWAQQFTPVPGRAPEIEIVEIKDSTNG
jgi:hypothetical protein